MISKIEELTEAFLDNFGIQYDELNIIEEKEKVFLIKIKSNESGLLIGPHGKNIDPINHILKLIIKGNFDEKIKICLEINDYSKTRDDRLKDLIISKIKQVEESGIDLVLPYYSAYDRKKIHGYVQDYKNDSIFTKSEGEKNQRRLYICKESKKLTIDIDGNDI